MVGDAGCGSYFECQSPQFNSLWDVFLVSDITIFRFCIPFNRWCQLRVSQSCLVPFLHSKCSWLNGKNWVTSTLIYGCSSEMGFNGHISITCAWITAEHMSSQCVSKLALIFTLLLLIVYLVLNSHRCGWLLTSPQKGDGPESLGSWRLDLIK